jgi:hypothetical protein
VAAPKDRGRYGGWIDPVDGGLESWEQADGAESQQALDGPGVVAEREHEKRVRKDLRELAANKHIARKGVAESRKALALGDPDNELGRVALHLFDVLSAERFPLGRGQTLEPMRSAELDG